jgi:hypothetical protein
LFKTIKSKKTIMTKYIHSKYWKTWLLSIISIIPVIACTGDLENDGAPLVGPAFGLAINPQDPQIIKTGTQIFTSTGGVAPYTYSLNATTIGTIVPVTGVFTARAIAGTAIVTSVDSTGAIGRTTVTVLPLQLVIDPGSAILDTAIAQIFTATLNSAAGVVLCSISRDNPSGTTAMPTVIGGAAACTVTATAVPAVGAASENFTITIYDTNDGDYGTAILTLMAPPAA